MNRCDSVEWVLFQAFEMMTGQCEARRDWVHSAESLQSWLNDISYDQPYRFLYSWIYIYEF